MSDERYEVHIKSHETNETVEVRCKGGESAWRADKVADGLTINLDLENYYLEFVEVSNA